jgi:hypothetical protein
MDRSDIPGTLQSIPRVAAGADRPVTREEMRLALRAVLVHTGQSWPGGVYCRSDRSPYPCRMHRWGERVLLAAGWPAEHIESMARRVAESDGWLADVLDDSSAAR